MTKDERLLKRALDVLDWAHDVFGLEKDGIATKTALRDRLAQPEQEPVFDCPRCGHCCPPQGIYYTPPQRTWVGLTDEEKAELDAEYGDDTLAHLDAIEAKLKEKNNG
tara:strand:+ start:636 stop:959 length:324 start_codon:yes stop_codon:yes gene_type:complete